MAGKPIGTIFVELDMDQTKYTNAQKAILQSASTTALNVEKNWKIIGEKSDVMYNAMRQSIVNAYEMIKNKAGTSAAEIIRAEEAKNAKLQALNDQQYGAHTSLIDSLKKHYIAASAAIVAAWMLVNRAIAYMDEGGKALQVESSFKIMANSAGANSEHLIESMKKATRATIDDSDLMQKAVKLMTLGYNPERIERFSKVVITASQIAGTTAAEAYDNLADAIANRMPKALVRMGAVTREQMEVVNKAIDAGADSTALYELAMVNLELKQKMLQGTQDTATISLQKFHAEMKEFKETIGKGLIIIVDAAYRAFEYLAAGVLGLVSAYARYRTLVYEIMGDEKKATDNRDVANAAWMARNELIKKAGEAIFLESEAGKKATQQEIADAKAKVTAQMAGLNSIIAAKEASKLPSFKTADDMWKSLKGSEGVIRIIQGETEELIPIIKNYESWWDKINHDLDEIALKLKMVTPEGAQWGAEEPLGLKSGEMMLDGTIYDIKFWERITKEIEELQLELLKSITPGTTGWEGAEPLGLKPGEMMMGGRVFKISEYEQSIKDMENLWRGLGDTISSSISGAMSSMIMGTQSAAEALKQIWSSIASYVIEQIAKMMVEWLLFEKTTSGGGTSGLNLLGTIGSVIGLVGGGGAPAGGPSGGGSSGGYVPAYASKGNTGQNATRSGGSVQIDNSKTTMTVYALDVDSFEKKYGNSVLKINRKSYRLAGDMKNMNR